MQVDRDNDLKAKATYVCGFHPERGGLDDYCSACIADHETRRAADEMTGEEREAELRALVEGPMSRPFVLIHQRAEELVNHPVWTHEFGVRFEGLCAEAREWKSLDMADVIGCIPDDKELRIVTVQSDMSAVAESLKSEVSP